MPTLGYWQIRGVSYRTVMASLMMNIDTSAHNAANIWYQPDAEQMTFQYLVIAGMGS